MPISPANLSYFKTTTSLIANGVFGSTPTIYPRIATTVPMGEAGQIVFGWMGMLPKPRLWTGPRVVIEAAAETYTLIPKLFEETLGIDQFELSDTGGMSGIYSYQVPYLARQLKRQPDYWMRDLLEASGDYSSTADQKGFDGLPAFSTSHPVDVYNQGTGGAGTYCNDFTGGGQVISIGGTNITVGGAIGLTSIATIREYMQTLKAQDGEPMGVIPDVLMHPSMMEMEVTTLLTAAYFSPPSYGTFTGQVGAVDNPGRRFALEPLKNELLVSPTKFYLLDTTKEIKPLLHVVREPTVMVTRLSPSDPIVFDEHKFLWGGWGRIAIGWGYSWLFARSGA